jgi:hypothetical protein
MALVTGGEVPHAASLRFLSLLAVVGLVAGCSRSATKHRDEELLAPTSVQPEDGRRPESSLRPGVAGSSGTRPSAPRNATPEAAEPSGETGGSGMERSDCDSVGAAGSGSCEPPLGSDLDWLGGGDEPDDGKGIPHDGGGGATAAPTGEGGAGNLGRAPVGDPGWRDSTEPLCSTFRSSIASSGIWSDERGVYVVAGGSGGTIVSASGSPQPSDLEIWFNAGTGWQQQLADDSGEMKYRQYGLTGFPNGPLVLYGKADLPNELGCGLATFEHDALVCNPVWDATSAFVVNAELAYAVVEGKLAMYRGGAWGPFPDQLTVDPLPQAIWASDTDLFATSRTAGTIFHYDGTWTSLETRTLQAFTAVWAFSPRDLWVGTEGGRVLREQGTGFVDIGWQAPQRCAGREIKGMWGSDGVLYFYTESDLVRVQGETIEQLMTWECPDDGLHPRITGVWGNSPSEVFIAVVDERENHDCGNSFVLVYDGAELHRF